MMSMTTNKHTFETTDTETTFIKIVSPKVAEQLALLGFRYIKEHNIFAFTCNDELIAVLRQQYPHLQLICENKLRF